MFHVERMAAQSTGGLFAIVICLNCVAAQADSQDDWLNQIDAADLKRHCQVLAADTLEGRAAGSRGGQAAAAYLVTELRKLGLEPAGDGKDFRQAFGIGYANVVARLPGGESTAAEEIIVVGAHYDHVGFGNSSNSYGPFGQIHNGADDNASGVSVLLEIAQSLQAAHPRPKRTILFAAWDAEEAGLLGSKHWVTQSAGRRPQIRLAVNLDMLGRLTNDRVIVMGWRSACGLRSLLAEHNAAASLAFQFEPNVVADSDHYPFYANQIPTLHFDTGKHADYHRPSDDVEKLNWDGMQRIARMMASFVRTAADADVLPAFRPECWREPAAPRFDPKARQAAPVRLGVSWNPQSWREGRVEILQVSPQSPAATAGLLPGDRLVQFDQWREGTTDELRCAITSAPQNVPMEWRRGGRETPLSAIIRLLGEQVRCGLVVVPDAALPGSVTISQVIETSQADRAGLQPGDVLLRWSDQPIASPEELARRVRADAGPIRLLVDRDGRLETKTLELLPP